MLALFKVLFIKLLAGGAAGQVVLPLALVALQVGTSTVQTQLSQKLENTHQIIHSNHQAFDQKINSHKDLITSSENGLEINGEFYSDSELDAKIIPLPQDRSPAAESKLTVAAQVVGSNTSETSNSTPATVGTGPVSMPEFIAVAPAIYPHVASAPAQVERSTKVEEGPAKRALAMVNVSGGYPLDLNTTQKKSESKKDGDKKVAPSSPNHSAKANQDNKGKGQDKVQDKVPDKGKTENQGKKEEEKKVVRPALDGFAGNTAANASIVTLEQLSNDNGSLYIASVTYLVSQNYVSHFSGFGDLNWTRVTVQCSNQGKLATEVWWAIGNGDTATSLEVNMHGEAEFVQVAITKWKDTNISDPVEALDSANTAGIGGGAVCEGPGTNGKEIQFPVNIVENNSVILVTTGFTKANSLMTFTKLTEVVQLESGTNGNGLNLAVGFKETTAAGNQDVTTALTIAAIWSSIAVEIKPAP